MNRAQAGSSKETPNASKAGLLQPLGTGRHRWQGLSSCTVWGQGWGRRQPARTGWGSGQRRLDSRRRHLHAAEGPAGQEEPASLVGRSPAPRGCWGLRVDPAWLLCVARGDSPRKPGLTADASPRALVGRAGEAALYSHRCPRLEPLMGPAGGVWPCQLEQKNTGLCFPSTPTASVAPGAGTAGVRSGFHFLNPRWGRHRAAHRHSPACGNALPLRGGGVSTENKNPWAGPVSPTLL